MDAKYQDIYEGLYQDGTSEYDLEHSYGRGI